MTQTLSEQALELIATQRRQWPLCGENYVVLGSVLTKTIELGGYPFVIQFNPARIISSAAKVDTRSIANRACFLCEANRPAEQRHINYTDTASGHRYQICVNPYPIAPQHLTVPTSEHTPQKIEKRIGDMLRLGERLSGFTIFYNGPRCGASAPDHMHFQAINRVFLPLEELVNRFETHGIYPLDTYPARAIVVIGESITEIEKNFETIYHNLQVLTNGSEEPMLNLLCWAENKEQAIAPRFKLVIFPRRAHRPTQYFAEGDEQIVFSPASIDMSGTLITARRHDFDRMTPSLIQEMLDQVSMDGESFRNIISTNSTER